MSDFIIRTEELSDEQIKELYVPTQNDKKILEQLKSQSPVLLVGSRGVGKSFLSKISQINLMENFEKEKIFPVFITFRSVSLIQSGNSKQFELWMLNRICTCIIRELKKAGMINGTKWKFGNISGEETRNCKSLETLININEKFENTWKHPGEIIETSNIPTIDEFMDIVEDMCIDLKIKRIVCFIDEAAHIFIPEQQRQFFTLFREIRSPYIKCNASIYPGVTCFGDRFEPMHDAVVINMCRDIKEDSYVENMKEMVTRQVKDSDLLKAMMINGQNFSILAYAAGGNPRLLLRSIEKIRSFNSNTINSVFREFYREEIWMEQSGLAEKYPGNSIFIDWGRKFVEEIVIPELKDKNDRFLSTNKSTTAYFWIHRNSPQAVKEALRILEYTGVIKQQALGIKATNAEIGTRYEVNIGCLLAFEANPQQKAMDIINNLSLGRMSEYGANSKAYNDLLSAVPKFSEPDMSECLKKQLSKSIKVLEITQWQKSKLVELNVKTIGELLFSTESKLMQAYYVGEVKARQMKNAAMAAVFEYLFG